MQRRSLAQIKKALIELRKVGWIKSNRSHNTGIGKTLEDRLGLTENNIALPDFGTMELKSQRIGSISMITLFTKSPQGIKNSEIRKRFGSPDPKYPKVKILHQTIRDGKPNRKGFHTIVDPKHKRLLILQKGKLLGSYDLKFLKQKAVEKIGDGLILVRAETKKIRGQEFFHYKDAYILIDIDPTKFISHSKYDIRLGAYHSGKMAGRPHDHGSAFRVNESALPFIFKRRIQLL